jgi:hypothetical protein
MLIIHCPVDYHTHNEGFDDPYIMRMVSARKVIFFSNLLAEQIAQPTTEENALDKAFLLESLQLTIEGYQRMMN